MLDVGQSTGSYGLVHLNVSISNKCLPISATYCVNNVPLVWRTSIRYMGLIITSNLCWTNHCKIISAKVFLLRLLDV